MKTYIVFESSFSPTNPKNTMARPQIKLVTLDISKAKQKVKEMEHEFSRWNDLSVHSCEDGSFDFFEADRYGKVGIIETYAFN